jgi:hypothetical protein
MESLLIKKLRAAHEIIDELKIQNQKLSAYLEEEKQLAEEIAFAYENSLVTLIVRERHNSGDFDSYVPLAKIDNASTVGKRLTAIYLFINQELPPQEGGRNVYPPELVAIAEQFS